MSSKKINIRTNRSPEVSTVNRLEVFVNKTRYYISESIDGKLTINKPDMDSGPIAVYPRYANEIDIL